MQPTKINAFKSVTMQYYYRISDYVFLFLNKRIFFQLDDCVFIFGTHWS